MFRDGLGERRHIADATGNDTLEVLCLRSELSTVPSFEFALRERVSRLASFRNEQFGRARSVERLNDRESTLAIVSERTAGVRLSELLTNADQRRMGLDITAALCLIRQLVPAVAMLHESAREVAHGAIGPERIVVTPDGRLVIMEYVLGAALEQLRYPRERYWSELRVALPSSAGLPRFDQRADVTQMGVVALSLILGRPMRDDEFPARIADVVASTWAVSPRGGFEPLPPGLRGWLGRALQLDVRTGFTSAIEARMELDKVLGDAADYSASHASLEAFLARYQSSGATPPPMPRPALALQPPVVAEMARPVPVPPAPAPVVVPPPPAAAVPVATPPRGTPAAEKPAPAVSTPPPGTQQPVQTPPPRGVVTPAGLTPAHGTPVPLTTSSLAAALIPPPPRTPVAPAPPPAEPLQLQSLADSVAVRAPTPARGVPRATPRPSYEQTQAVPVMVNDDDGAPAKWPKLAAMAAALLLLVAGGAFAGRRYLMPTPAATTGTLAITTNPAGAQALVDGQVRGVTPVTLELPAGPHRIELRGAAGGKTIPVTITAGTQVAQYIELPHPATGVGQLQVRTEPAGARVTVDGVARGTSPATVADLTPGDHAVLLESDLGSVKQSVTIEAGITASLVAPMTAPEGAPVSGWIAVSSPVEMQLFEKDRLLGTSRTDRIMVSAGRHEIDIVSDELGYRATRTVQVPAGKVTPVKVEMPSGSIAINAVPWAEVWIDGSKVGETPIGNLTLPIGNHDVVFRHPELGEQHHTATVTLKNAARLSIDLRKK